MPASALASTDSVTGSRRPLTSRSQHQRARPSSIAPAPARAARRRSPRRTRRSPGPSTSKPRAHARRGRAPATSRQSPSKFARARRRRSASPAAVLGAARACSHRHRGDHAGVDELDRLARPSGSRSGARARRGSARASCVEVVGRRRSARTTGRGSAGRRSRRSAGSSRSSRACRLQRGERRPRARRARRARAEQRAHVVAADVGDRQPERAEHAAGARHEHASAIPSSSASAQACSPPGAAEGHEREVARVEPALHRDHPQRAAPSRRWRRARRRARSRSASRPSSLAEPAERRARRALAPQRQLAAELGAVARGSRAAGWRR